MEGANESTLMQDVKLLIWAGIACDFLKLFVAEYGASHGALLCVNEKPATRAGGGYVAALLLNGRPLVLGLGYRLDFLSIAPCAQGQHCPDCCLRH